MRTAIDTNVLTALWSKQPLASDIAKTLGNAKTEGGLADFIIGSHALAQADRLMTLDPKRYKQDFPELKLT